MTGVRADHFRALGPGPPTPPLASETSGESRDLPPDLTLIEVLAAATALVFAALVLVAAYYAPAFSRLPSRFAAYWLGMGVLTVSAAWVFLYRRLPRPGMLLLVTSVGVITYLPKLFRSLPRPAYVDELLHLHQAGLLSAGGVLLGHNLMDPTVGFFPLFQVLVVGIHAITGLTLWHGALIVAGLGHVAQLVAISLFVDELFPTRHLGGLSALLFVGGSSVQFWMSEASYQTVALPLAVLTLWACVRWARGASGRWLAAAAAGMVLTVLAQPVSSVFLAGTLLLLGVADARRGRTGFRRLGDRLSAFAALGVLALGLLCAWFALMGWGTIWGYILPSGGSLWTGLRSLLHPGTHRSFYSAGFPVYEQYAGDLVLLAAPLAIAWGVMLYHRGRLLPVIRPDERVGVRVCFAFAFAYVLSYPLNLSSALLIWVHRSWQLDWVGICPLLAALLTRAVPATGGRSRLALFRPAAALSAVLILAIGNTATGSPPDYMFPLSYRLDSGVGLVTRQQVEAARWLKRHAPGARIAADVDTDVVQWAYGGARPLPFPTWKLTFPTQPLTVAAAGLAGAAGLQYLVVDRLMYRQASADGYLYSPEEPGTYGTRPLPDAAYANLLATPWLRRVYVNSQMTIFRVDLSGASGS